MNIFSIVVPVHNKEKYIDKTLTSVLQQTYPYFELILVNDGSKDSSGAICDKYAASDQRIKVIHQQNGGVSNARNTGIKAASTELIAFLDADDWWDSEFLNQMKNLIARFADINIYSAKFATIQKGKIITGENFFPAGKKFIVFDLVNRCAEKARFPIHTSSVIIKKKAIEEAGFFDERITNFEDYDFFLRIALLSKIAYLNIEPLSFYNNDVPHESKARGPVPSLSKHWISHIGKFDNDLKYHRNLKLLLDRSILSQLIIYRQIGEYKDQVKTILGKVSKANYGWKYGIIYLLPPILGNNLINIYSIIIKVIRKFK